MRRGFVVFLMAAVALAAGCRKPKVRLEPFSSEPGRFRVLLPGKPVTTDEARETPAGTVQVHGFSVSTEQAVYHVSYADYPLAAVRKQGVDALLKATATAAVQAVNGVLLSSSDVTEKGQPGKDIRFEAQSAGVPTKGIGRGHLFMVGTRLYQVLIIGETSIADAPTTNQVLDSFTFTFADNQLPTPPVATEPEPPTSTEPTQAAKTPAAPPENAPGAIVRSQHTVEELYLTEYTLPANEIARSVLWTSSGDGFYVLMTSGALMRVDPRGLRIARQAKLNEEAQWLSRSALGLLVTLPAREQVWLLDPDSLEVKKRYSVLAVKRALSSPGLSLAIAAGGPENETGSVLDLKSGQVVRQYHGQDLKPPTDFGTGVVTPDGKYLFTQSQGQLGRFRIQGTSLTYEDTSAKSNAAGQVAVSADSRHVALLSAGGAAGGEELPSGSSATPVYTVTDLHKPAMTLQQTAAPVTMAWDPKGGVFYTQSADNVVRVYRSNGAQVKEYRIGSGEPRQLAVSPDGSGLLVLTSEALYHVTIPNGRFK